MESLKVKDYMIYQPVTFNPETLLAQAATKLLHAKQLGAPVIDNKKQLLGFISEQDCMMIMLKGTYHCDMMMPVSDCMRKDVLSVGLHDSVLAIAESMTGQKPKVLPVVDDDKVIGIITRSEILTAICTHLNTKDNPL
ncbi:MAG: CBS domain-containing protein [Shewanellaceae bacterium]|nr:CBS domain-containing protein [Shewanellaceae bacterium]